MNQLIIMMIIILLLPLFLFALNLLISKKTILSREKISPFECGFDPMSLNHMPFSIHFFLISLIFLIFDIEITLLIPLIPMFINFKLYMILTSFIFLLILIIGLFIEYAEQSIDWKL